MPGECRTADRPRGVVDRKPFLDRQTGSRCDTTELGIGEDMPVGRIACPVYIPGGDHVAISFTWDRAITQHPEDSRKKTIVKPVVTVADVDKQQPPGR